ncbi:MAG: response regulator [Fibrobacterota bacterium]
MRSAKQKQKWKNIQLTDGYYVTLEKIGSHIISSHNSGSLNEFKPGTYYSLVNRFIVEENLSPPYIELRNYQYLTGCPPYSAYISQKNIFHTNRDIFGAIFVYNCTRTMEIKLSLAFKVLTHSVPLVVADNKEQALKKIEQMLPLLEQNTETEKNIRLHLPRTVPAELMPDGTETSHGLKWSNLLIGEKCWCSMEKISPKILFLKIVGDPYDMHGHTLVQLFQKFMGEYNITPPAILMISTSGKISRISKKNRHIFRSFFTRNSDIFLSLINIDFSLREKLRALLGFSFFSTVQKYYVIKSYNIALKKAHRLLAAHKEKTTPESSGMLTMDDLNFKPQWHYRDYLSDAYYKSGVINKKLLYSEAGGTISLKNVEEALPYLENIFTQNHFTGSSYIRIINFTYVIDADSRAQKRYITKINELNKRYLCWPRVTFICGANLKIKSLARLFGPILNQKIIFVPTVSEAFERISREDLLSPEDLDTEYVISATDIQNVTEYASNLIWENNDTNSSTPVSPLSPLYDLGQSLIAVKDDLNQLREVEKKQKEDLKTNLQKMRELNNQLKLEKIIAEKLKKQAVEANNSKSLFLANMSHEIRTPMNGIQGVIQLLRETHLDENQQEYLGIIEKSSGALLTIINDILDISKIESNKLTLEKIPFNLVEVISDASDSLTYQISRKGLLYKIFIDPRLPESVLGDPTRLQQILLNLIGNAYKFTQHGSIIVRAELTSRTEKTCSFTLNIEDTGIGITQNQQKNLFTEFIQADASTTRKFGGTGLGLAISKKIIDMMNGDISLKSIPDRGSVFSVSLALPLGEEKKHVLSTEIQTPLLFCSPDTLLCNNWFLYCLEKKAENFRIISNDTAIKRTLLQKNIWAEYRCIIVDEDCLSTDSIANLNTAIQKETLLIVMQSIGGNSRFTLQIPHAAFVNKPITISKVIKKMNPSKKTQEQPLLEASGKTKKILLAEDNGINQKITQKILQKIGFDCTIADNGKEAVEHFQNERFDLVLMDIQMPVMDGYEATEKIRLHNASIPVIAMTANVMDAEQNRCMRIGMSDFISKPVRIEELRSILEKWLS